MLKSKLLWTALAVVAIATFTFGNAFAEDVAPAAKPVEAKVADRAEPTTTEAVEVKTKTETPVCSMLKWIGTQVKAAAGEDCKCCGAAMKKWFDGGADVPLAGMRDQLVADGWTAETTVAFMKKMKAERAAKGDCAGCDKAKDCAGCDKAADCAGCDKAADCDGAECADCEGCDGCPKGEKGDCGGCPCDKAAKKDAAPKKDAKP